jgi:sodium transport system permease protein
MIFTIFKKELKDTLRDRRTLIAMIVIPVLVFPLILGISTSISASFADKQQNEVFSIALLTDDIGNKFVQELLSIPDSLGPKTIQFYAFEEDAQELILSDSAQIAIAIPSSFDADQATMKSSEITIYFKETNMGARQRAQLYGDLIEKTLQNERYTALDLDPSSLSPFSLNYTNLSSDKEMLGKYVGGFIPYLFIIFGFIGCLYPAIDLFTGEKERKTLETLLTAPIARWKILVGKMLVIVLSGIAAASFAMIGLFLSIELFDFIENPKILEAVNSILTFKFIALLFVLLLPLTIFFAGIMIPVTIYAKSFKEAQSILTPINFLIILPAMVGFIPGIELNYSTALIPIVNIVLASKELVADTLRLDLLLLSFFVMVAFAALSVMISYKRFGRESNIVS